MGYGKLLFISHSFNICGFSRVGREPPLLGIEVTNSGKAVGHVFNVTVLVG